MKIKNSVDLSNSKTNKLREQFVKLYGNKKGKYLNKSLLEGKKHEDEEAKLQACNRVRSLKLNNDLGFMYMKNQCEELNNRLIAQNKKIS